MLTTISHAQTLQLLSLKEQVQCLSLETRRITRFIVTGINNSNSYHFFWYIYYVLRIGAKWFTHIHGPSQEYGSHSNI